MKKSVFFIILLQAILFIGCTMEPLSIEDQESNITKVMEVIKADIDTDLDLGWIHRTPEIPYVWDSDDPKTEGWPAAGQTVTWEANIINWGSTRATNVEYQWILNNKVVESGVISSIEPDGRTKLNYNWTWTFTRNTIELVLDPLNKIPELSEKNNQLLVYTDALAVGFWVEQGVYDYFHQYQNNLNIGSNSWEDWAQRQIGRFNDMFIKGGVKDRVRIDAIHVVADGALPLNGGLPTNNPDMNDRTIDLQWGFPSVLIAPDNPFYKDHTTVSDQNAFYFEGSLLHELGHGRYLIDVYGFNVHDTGAGDTVAIMENGENIVGTDFMPMVNGDTVYQASIKGLMNGDYSFVDSYSVTALNLIAGNRAILGNYNAPGNIGVFLNDLPAQNRLTVKDQKGNNLAGAKISLYQATGKESWYGKYYDNIPDITGLTTDKNGQVLLGKSPFSADGTIVSSYGLCNGVLIVRAEHNGRVGYGFLESLAFNQEYWSGNTSLGQYVINLKMVGVALPKADLLPRPITYTGKLVAGQAINFDSGITNQGNAASGNFNIKWFFNGQNLGYYGSHSSVPAGTTVMNGNSAVSWTPTAAGTYTIEFVVDVDGHVAESNENNNRTSITIKVEAPAPVKKADLLPRPITYSGKLVTGQSINFNSGITNQGNVASGIFNVKWFFNGQNLGYYGSHSSVPAGTTVMNGNSAVSWKPTAAGTYTIEFVVDVDGHVVESNENNNRTSITIKVEAPTPVKKADLLPRPITYSGKLMTGQTINFNSGITNQGNAASGIFNVKWLFNGQNLGYYGSHSSVPAGTTVMNGNSAASWTPSAAGTYRIDFVVDVDGQVAESNENNNRTSITIKVEAPTPVKKADLLPRPISYSGKLVAGQAINFNSGITNQGNVASGIFNVKWLFNGQNLGYYGSHSSVPAGTTVMNGNSAASWTPPTAGTYRIDFVVDVDGQVAESNENNNRTSITIRIN